MIHFILKTPSLPFNVRFFLSSIQAFGILKQLFLSRSFHDKKGNLQSLSLPLSISLSGKILASLRYSLQL